MSSAVHTAPTSAHALTPLRTPRLAGRFRAGLIRLSAVILLVASLPLGAQTLDTTRVYIEPFRNQTDNAAVATLGDVLVSEMRLTIALLDGFELVDSAPAADILITSSMDVLEGGIYRSISAVEENGQAVSVVELEFPSVFDVFDAGGQAGEQLLSSYTNQVLEFARLVIAPSRRPDGLEISIDGQQLDLNSLQLDRVLTGTRRVVARFAGSAAPFFSRELELESDADVRVEIPVPALGPSAYREALIQRSAAGLATEEDVPQARVRDLRERFSAILAAQRVRVVRRPFPNDLFAARSTAYDAVAGGFTMPWLRDAVITVDGDPSDWASVPVHTRSATAVGRFAHDSDRFYGHIEAPDMTSGEGLEVSIQIYAGPGRGSEVAQINIPMARLDADGRVRLKVFANVNGSWSTRYETSTTAVYRDGAFEFAVPVSVLRAPQVERNTAGVPAILTVDTEAGVRISGDDFDYGLYDFSGQRSLNAIMERVED